MSSFQLNPFPVPLLEPRPPPLFPAAYHVLLCRSLIGIILSVLTASTP